MIISLISLALGVVAALLTYFFTPLAALPWPHAFWIIPMSLGYGLGAFMILVISFFLFCMAHPLEKDVKKPRRAAYWLVCQIIQWLFGFLWIKAEITGAEKVPTDSRFLMVSNHTSMFDFLIVLAHLGRFHIIPILKKEAEHFPIAGKCSHYTGFIPIDRSNPKEGLRAILKAVRFLKEDLSSIYIAPEGTRNKDGRMSSFHAGSFKIAQKAQVPVVIACVTGTQNVHSNFFRRFTHVRLDFLEVLSKEQVAEMTTVEMAEHSQELIQARLDELEKKE